MIKTIVIYHGRCPDGFGASFIFWYHLVKLRGQDIEFYPGYYGGPPPDIKGKNVYIVDFSYPRDVLLQMKKDALDLVVLDHHKSAQQDLQGLPFCIFDMNKSGVRLAWDFFAQSIDFYQQLPLTPNLISYIEDMDLWNWKLPSSKEINASIGSYPQTFLVWDKLLLELDNDLNKFIHEGSAILRYQKEVINILVAKAEEVDLLGFKVLAVNTPILFSEVASQLSENRPFGICWHKSHDYIYSLRSIKGASYAEDVSLIAQKFGGGGHQSSAGFHRPILII